MKVISLTNSKLGAKIPSVNLPITVCRADAPCKEKGCYAKKGNWLYNNTKKSLARNLESFNNDSENFFNDIIDDLNGDVIYKFMRWHSSGDIVNYKYLLGIIKVAEALPMTKFLCFTKKFMLVNTYLDLGNKLPENLKIVFSAWDKNFEVQNPHNLPVTYVSFKDKTQNADIPEFAIPCVGGCEKCKACWSLEKGQSVVFEIH